MRQRHGAGSVLLVWLLGHGALAWAALPLRPDPEAPEEAYSALSWRNRLQDALQPESALPPQARSGETLLAGEHSEAQWGISGYADLVREWDEPVQTSQSLELGTLYWRTPLGERSQLQVGKFTLDIDPSYGSHPAGFFQAAANPFDDFLPDVGTPMLALTHWWGEAWSGNLLLQKSPDDGSRRAGAVLTYQTAEWLIHGVVTERSPEEMENAVTLLHPGQGLWSWHGSLAGSGRGEDKLDLLLGTVREDEQDKLVLEYSYNRNRYTYRQLWHSEFGEEAPPLPRWAWLDNYHVTLHQSLYLEYDRQSDQREWLLAAMVAQDGSAITQLRHSWLLNAAWRSWLEVEHSSGGSDSTYGYLPWRWQFQLGWSWSC